MKTIEQRRGWILRTDMTCDDVLCYFARNFCVAISNASEVNPYDQIVVCDKDSRPCIAGKVKNEISIDSYKVNKRCRDCVLQRCGVDSLYDFVPYFKCQKDNINFPMVSHIRAPFFCELNSAFAAKLFEEFATENALCRIGECSRWCKPGKQKDIVAIFQCPGYSEFVEDKPLAADTGKNARYLFKLLSWNYDDITIVNATPIPHRPGEAISSHESKRFLKKLKEVVNTHRKVLCCGEVAYNAYAELKQNKDCITICHLGPLGIRKLSKEKEKVPDFRRIEHLANYIKDRTRNEIWRSNSWNEFTNDVDGHSPFHWAKRGGTK